MCRTSLLGSFIALAIVCSLASIGAASCPTDIGSQISNGSFNGQGCWALNATPQLLVPEVYWTDSFYARIVGGTSYDAVQLTQSIPVDSGTTYELSLRNWSVPMGTTVTIGLQRDSDPYETYGLWQNVALDGSVDPIRFTCSQTDPAARFVIFLGQPQLTSQDTVTIALDELHLGNITCNQNDLIVNPSFDCGPYPNGWNWWSGNAATTFTTAPGAFHGASCLQMTSMPGGAFYDAFVEQLYINWVANRYYMIRFWAKATDTTNQITVSMKNDATGSTPMWLTYTLTNDWQPYTFIFRATETTNQGHFKIWNGMLAQGSTFWCDAVQLVEVPMPDFNPGGVSKRGDFDGDGKSDLLYAEMRDRWYLWVARSTGDGFGAYDLWGTWFGSLGGKLVVGNWNGIDADSLKRDDVAIVMQGQPAFIRLSDGTQFSDPGTNPWSGTVSVAVNDANAGDFDGDGKDDIALFAKGSTGGINVLRSNGGSFLSPTSWNSNFGRYDEMLFTGDFNGDGRDDQISFVRKNEGNVFVALSTGSAFNGGQQWAGLFVQQQELPEVGYLDADNRCDVICMKRGQTDRRVFVKRSTGVGFSTAQLWHGYFVGPSEVPATGDFNGDGLTDLSAQDTLYSFWQTQSWGGNFGDVVEWYSTDITPYIAPPSETATGVVLGEHASSPTLTASAFPNPFRTTTDIVFSLAQQGRVSVTVYDVTGRELRQLVDEERFAGEQRIRFDASDLSPGVYFSRITAGSMVTTRKMILVR